MRTAGKQTKPVRSPEELDRARKEKARAFRAAEAAKALEKAAKAAEQAKQAEERKAAWRDLKLPVVQSYALCDEPDEVAECKAFADAMYLKIAGKRWRSHEEVAQEKAAKAAAASDGASSSGAGGVGK